MVAMTSESIERYKTLGRALRLTGGRLEVVVTLDVGPRTMHVSLPGGPNMFADECPLKEELPDGTVFEYFGGHRVWHSPEAFPRSYVPDSHPLARHELYDDGILMVQQEEPWTHIVKAVELRFGEGSVAVTSSLTNNGAWPIEMAVWSPFLGSHNGRLILPVTQRNTGLLPNTSYVLWPYARMDDPRVHWGRRFIVLDHDERAETQFKLGYPNELGWLAYVNHGCCLVKRFAHERGARLPRRRLQLRGLHGRVGDRHRVALAAATGEAGRNDHARGAVVRVRLSGAAVDRRRRDRGHAGAVRPTGRVRASRAECRGLGPDAGQRGVASERARERAARAPIRLGASLHGNN